MDDNLNQDLVTETSEDLNQDPTDEGLFDDYDGETAAAEEPKVESTEDSNDAVETKPFLTVQYNDEQRNLTEDDARTLAQKGMNYDRIYEPLERLARMNGITVGEYLNSLNDTQINYEIANEVENLRNDSKYEGTSDEVLEEIARTHVMENLNLQDRRYEEAQRESADALNAQAKRDVERFLNEYPEFRNKGSNSLDPKVLDYVKEGYSLLEAYEKYKRETPQAKASRLNEENRRKSLGNTANAGSVDTDDFLSGFLKG